MLDVSPLRLNLLRAYYLLILVERSIAVAPALFGWRGPLGPFDGTAYSFWAALALLAVVGLRYPLKMLPLLLIHLAYKSLWLLAVALPLWRAQTPFDPAMTRFAWAMAAGVALDLLIIPWPYVIARYVRHPAEPWRAQAR
jgi:hypothetical protein